jgi:tetraacyldisaccharide 4'-kinase
LHELALRLRHLCFDAGLFPSRRAALPTWVIGNITVGGTGKSPHVRLFVKELEEVVGKGNVGVLSRGYGRSTRGFTWVDLDSLATEVGDEPLMLKRQMPHVPVAACADRLAGVARMHLEQSGLRWVVLDDAFQHRRLKPDVSTVLLDATQPVAGDRLLPAGWLRDLQSSLRRADSALITRVTVGATDWKERSGWSGPGPIWATSMIEGALIPWSAAAKQQPVPQPAVNPSERARIIAVAGIARPERFIDGLARAYQIVRRESHPDHHRYSQSEVKRWIAAFDTDGIATIVTTEKDAARLEPFRELLDRVPVHCVPLLAEWHDAAGARAWLRDTALEVERRTSPKKQDI